MSVIVKDIDNTLHVFSKGAETTMFAACTRSDVTKTEQQLTSFARLGLRTLVLGHKTISEEEHQTFTNSMEIASQSLVNRAKLIREAYTTMEQDFELIGVTGIEDKLQDEVVSTIQDLKLAKIKVWMLTGDKKETAINLGHSAGLLTSQSSLIDLCDNADPRDVTTLISEIVNGNVATSSTEGNKVPALVIDGKGVTTLLKNSQHPESQEHLKILAAKCDTVIACRLSPIQKSQLVRMMKSELKANIIFSFYFSYFI